VRSLVRPSTRTYTGYCGRDCVGIRTPEIGLERCWRRGWNRVLQCPLMGHCAELARLAKVHITTIVRLEAFDAQQVRGQSGTITAVVSWPRQG
jgi:hypothetical protein